MGQAQATSKDGSYPLADFFQLDIATSRAIRPLKQPHPPILPWRIPVPRDDPDMEMGHVMTNNEDINVFGVLASY